MLKIVRRISQAIIVLGLAALLVIPRPGTLRATGVVEAAVRAPVYARVGGAIVEVLVKEGDRVVAGQRVGRLRSDVLAAAVAREELELQKRESALEALVKGARREELVRGAEQLAGKRRVLAAVETELRRAERMHKDKLASDEELQTARDRVAQAQAEVVAAAAAFRLLQGGARPAEVERQQALVAAQRLVVEQARADVAATDLFAASAGVVVGLDPAVRLEAHLAAGDRFCDIVDDGALRLTVHIAEREFADVDKGMVVEVRAASDPERRRRGTIVAVLPQMARSSSSSERFLQVVIDVDNADRRVPPHAQATVQLETIARAPLAAAVAPIVRWLRLRFFF